MNVVIFSSHPLLAMAMGQIIKRDDRECEFTIKAYPFGSGTAICGDRVAAIA